jgi:hypothetical protein
MRLPVAAALFAILLAASSRAAEVAVKTAGPSWQEKLGFTDEQARKFSDAEKIKEDALLPLRTALRDALQTVRSQVAEKAGDKEVAVTLEQIARAQKDILGVSDAFNVALASFLTPTQRAQLLIGTPLGAARDEGAASRKVKDRHEALTDDDAEEE